MEYKIYKVVSGDNLTKIAKANNTTVNELVQINGIKNPNLIYVGQEIKIPVAEAAPAAPAASTASYATTTYKIKPGDNLTKIAKEFDTTVEELVKLNNIANPNLIIAGADLIVPSAGGKPTAEALAARQEGADVLRHKGDVHDHAHNQQDECRQDGVVTPVDIPAASVRNGKVVENQEGGKQYRDRDRSHHRLGLSQMERRNPVTQRLCQRLLLRPAFLLYRQILFYNRTLIFSSTHISII